MLLSTIKHNTKKVPVMADDLVCVHILNALVKKSSSEMGKERKRTTEENSVYRSKMVLKHLEILPRLPQCFKTFPP